MPESIKPPFDYEEGSPNNEEAATASDEERPHQFPDDERSSSNKPNENIGAADRERPAQPLDTPPPQKTDPVMVEKASTPEKETQRNTVKSFAELMVRGDKMNTGARVRIWDMGIKEGINYNATPNLWYQEAVPEAGSYIDGRFFRVEMPYRFIFDCFGPDLNNPGKAISFWGGTVNSENFSEWADKIDIGPDYAKHSQDWYEQMYQQEVRRYEEREASRRR